MKITEKIKNIILGLKTTTYTRLDEDRFFRGNSNATASAYRSPTQFMNAYIQIGYIGQGASKIGDHVARLAWKLTDQRGKEMKDAVITALLNNEYGFSTDYETIINMSVMHYCLDGNIFWLKDYRSVASKASGKPDAIIPIPPHMVDIYDDMGMLISSTTSNCSHRVGQYMVRMKSGAYTIEPEHIIHVRNPSPFNQIRGMGIVQQNSIALERDRYRDLFNQAAFAQGGRFNAYLTPQTERPLSNQQINEVKEQLKSEVYGYGNSGKIPVMPHNFKLESIDLNFRELEILEQNKMSREDVMAMFSIPPLVYGITSEVRYDSAREQMRVFYEICLPRFTPAIERAVNRVIACFDKRLRFQFIIPHFYDAATAKDFFDRGAITRNELREVGGFERAGSELDDRYMTMQYVPDDEIAMATVQPAQPAPPTPPEPEQPEGEKKIRITQAEQYRIHRRAIKTRRRVANTIDLAVQKFYRGMIDRTLANIPDNAKGVKANEIDIDDIFDAEDETLRAYNDALRWQQSAVAVGVNDSNEIWGLQTDNTSKNPDVVLVVEKLAKRYADLTIETRREELRGIITAWRETGEGVSSLKRQVQDLGGLYGENAWKSQRIARTEASMAYDSAQMIGYREIGVTTFDVIGCEDEETDCNRTGIPLNEVAGLTFHPNHTGTIVPAA
jgi:HK97 family phage portal protein